MFGFGWPLHHLTRFGCFWAISIKILLTFYREFFRWYFYRSSNEVHVIVSRNSFWVYFFFFPIVWLPRPDPLNQRVKIRVPLNLESSHARPLNVVDWRSDRRSVSDQIQSTTSTPSPRIKMILNLPIRNSQSFPVQMIQFRADLSSNISTRNCQSCIGPPDAFNRFWIGIINWIIQV